MEWFSCNYELKKGRGKVKLIRHPSPQIIEYNTYVTSTNILPFQIRFNKWSDLNPKDLSFEP